MLHLGREFHGAEMQNRAGLGNDVCSLEVKFLHQTRRRVRIGTWKYSHSVLFGLLISQVYAMHNGSQSI
jgi:hypothetical protein